MTFHSCKHFISCLKNVLLRFQFKYKSSYAFNASEKSTLHVTYSAFRILWSLIGSALHTIASKKVRFLVIVNRKT